MIEAQNVAKILGLSPAIHSYAQLESEVSKGLPKKSLKLLAARIFPGRPTPAVLLYCHKVVPRATYNRRRERLTAAESEKTSRIARIVAFAEHVWRNEDDAREWMNTPLPELQGRTPADAAQSELGAIQVEDVLNKLLFGLPV
jgi:putative toxin-antitoxin system antitoxin component (TIGR02293 family)